MKRFIIILILLLSGMNEMLAQKGLAVNEQFDGSKSYYENATRVWVEGKDLKAYHLTLYKSITVKGNAEAAKDMERAVTTDSKLALSKEIGHVGSRLYYAFLSLPGKQHNRYIFFRNASLRSGGADEVTLVYMEGNVSMEQLKQMFKK